jgi:hypothetical protein
MNLKNLKYFKGKVCSVFTHPINRNFHQENPKNFIQQNVLYFVGLVEDIEEEGILITQLQTGFKSYFFLANIIAICEEEVLDPSKEQDAKVIDDIRNKDAQIREMMTKYDDNKNQGVINLNQLQSLIKPQK